MTERAPMKFPDQATRYLSNAWEAKRDGRWFRVGLRLFGAAAAMSLTIVALGGGLMPMRFLGSVSLAAALLGFGVCALGLRLCNPAQWRAGVQGVQWKLGLRELPPTPRRKPALGEARPVDKRDGWPATA